MARESERPLLDVVESAIARGHAGAGGLSPEPVSQRVAESLSLMKRHRDSSTHAGGVVHRKRNNGDVAFPLVKSIDQVREGTGFALEPDGDPGVFGSEPATRTGTRAGSRSRRRDGRVCPCPAT